jgi:hypothetical protein
MDHVAHLVVVKLEEWDRATLLLVRSRFMQGMHKIFFLSALRALPISIKVLDEEHVFLGFQNYLLMLR